MMVCVNLEKLERAIRELCDIPETHIIYISVDEKDICFYHGNGYGRFPVKFGHVSRHDAGLRKLYPELGK